jgi:uncharacterized membrane protein YhdT
MFKGENILGWTIRNYLEEWLRNQKCTNHFPRPFTLNFFTIIIIFSCLSIACINIWFEVYFGIEKSWKLLKNKIPNQNGSL